jgi:hypothetical protein
MGVERNKQGSSRKREVYWGTPNAAKGGGLISVGIANRYGLDGLRMEYWWVANFSVSSKPAPRPTKPAGQWVPDLSENLVLTSHLLLVFSCGWVTAIPSPPLRASIGMSRGDHYQTRKSYLRDFLGAWRKTPTVVRLVQMPKVLRHGQVFQLALGLINFSIAQNTLQFYTYQAQVSIGFKKKKSV